MDISKHSRDRFLPVILVCISFIILLVSSLGGYYGRDWGRYIFIKNFGKVWDENQKLNEENSLLLQKVTRIGELESDNRRLRRLLGFLNSSPEILVAASVIGQEPNNWYQCIIIDKGGKHGVSMDMATVTTDGLVGRVSKVWPDMSKVQLIIDQSSGVGAMVQRTRVNGVVVGMLKNSCEFKYFDDNEDIQEGDVLITSGLGMVYPKGIMIGAVSKIEQKALNLDRYVEVKPFVHFSRLEDVFVLRKR